MRGGRRYHHRFASNPVAHGEPIAYAEPDAHGEPDAHSNASTHSNANPHPDTHTIPDALWDGYAHSYSNAFPVSANK